MTDPEQPKITLYTYAASPYGMKVYWALQYKRLEFDVVYVNPVHKKEIEFTGGVVVPITRIGDQWKQDSRETCLWLDELFPENPLAGSNEQERQKAIEADQWVTHNLIALLFRSVIDIDEGLARYRNANKLSGIMKATATRTPWYLRLVWARTLRTTNFVVNHAAALDPEIDINEHRANVLQGMEERVRESGFFSGTDQPCMADMSAYANIAFCETYDFEYVPKVSSSMTMITWFDRMSRYFPPDPSPALLPKWPLVRTL